MDLSETAASIFSDLVKHAITPGIVDVEYGGLGYKIPGRMDEVKDFYESIGEHPLRELDRTHIEFVQGRTRAHVYIPRFLLITGPENLKRADQLRMMPYSDYLETWEWTSRRDLVRLRDENACTRCGLCVDVRELHVHHKTYERRGIERLDDLTTLCSRCHYDAHRWELEATS